MSNQDPLELPPEAFTEILDKISSDNSPVGIDAKHTHAIIIAYLRQISKRLDALEAKIGD